MVASILLIFWGSSIGEPESQSFRWIMAAIRPLCVHTFDSMMSQLRSDNTAKTSDRRPTLSVPVSSGSHSVDGFWFCSEIGSEWLYRELDGKFVYQ